MILAYIKHNDVLLNYISLLKSHINKKYLTEKKI